MPKSKNWRNGENTGNFTNIKKPKMWVLGNVYMGLFAHNNHKCVERFFKF